VLVRHLPRDSALARERHGEGAEWTVTDHLLAQVADRLAEANWMFAMVHRDEDSEPLEYPEPVSRPGRPTGPGDEDDAGSPAGMPSQEELAVFFRL
jgi:hypothetical protein